MTRIKQAVDASALTVMELGAKGERIGAIVETRRSRCVLFDREQQALWCPGDGYEEASAAVGLASFIVRTGMTVCLARLDGDPRADLELDNPDGDPSDRFLGIPVRAPRGAIVAVLIALRPERDSAFEPAEVAMTSKP